MCLQCVVPWICVGCVAHLHPLMRVCSVAMVTVAVCSCAVNVAFIVVNVVTVWRSDSVSKARLASADVWVVCMAVSVAAFYCPYLRQYCA